MDAPPADIRRLSFHFGAPGLGLRFPAPARCTQHGGRVQCIYRQLPNYDQLFERLVLKHFGGAHSHDRLRAFLPGSGKLRNFGNVACT